MSNMDNPLSTKPHGAATAATPPAPVLGYARSPGLERWSWIRRPIWARLAQPAAAVYAFVYGLLILVATLVREPGDDPGGFAAALVLSGPLFFIALALGILGHYSPGGRRLAGPALWVVALTPGSGALLHAIGSLLMQTMNLELAGACAGVIALNALIVLALRGRILKASPEELQYD